MNNDFENSSQKDKEGCVPATLEIPCRICCGTDLCGTIFKGQISLCIRNKSKANFSAHNSRWGVFFHKKQWKYAPTKKVRRFLMNLPPLFAEPVVVEIRHLAYQYILKKSPAGKIPELISGSRGLNQLGIEQIKDYGALPQKKHHRAQLAANIVELIKKHYPEFLKDDLWQLTRIPGFWIDDQKQPQFWYPINDKRVGLLVPYRTQNGLIQFMQMRFAGDTEGEQSYQWLSVGKMPGVKIKPPIHFADWRNNISANHKQKSVGESIEKDTEESMKGKTLLITEGALQADTIHSLLQTNPLLGREVSVIANSGITTSHNEIASLVGGRKILLAFNSADDTNIRIRRALNHLFGKLETFSVQPEEIKILRWDSSVKSLDRALRENLPITTMTRDEWRQKYFQNSLDSNDNTDFEK